MRYGAGEAWLWERSYRIVVTSTSGETDKTGFKGLWKQKSMEMDEVSIVLDCKMKIVK